MKFETTGLVMGALALGLVALTGPASADSRAAGTLSAIGGGEGQVHKVGYRGHFRGHRSRGFRSYGFRGHHKGFRFNRP